jgi:Tfp pilus assembly protein PilO
MKHIGVLLLIFFLSACQADSPYESFHTAGDAKEAEYYDQEEVTSSDELAMEDRKIIKTADIRFQVDDLEASTKKIEQLTADFKGLISSMNQTNSSRSINNYLTVRIPAEKLTDFLTRIEEESIYTITPESIRRMSPKNIWISPPD